MYTVSDILEDVDRGCAAHNMIETCFSYRIVYYINENGAGRKCYVDTTYENLRQSLKNIIRGNLSTTNSIVISVITVWKNGESVSLLNRAYGFSLDGYFRQINGEDRNGNNNGYGRYGRYTVRQPYDRGKDGKNLCLNSGSLTCRMGARS